MGIVYAKSAVGTTNEHGVMYRLASGEAWDSDAALVKLRPQLFDALPPRVRSDRGWRETGEVVETATAKPGEKRRTKRA